MSTNYKAPVLHEPNFNPRHENVDSKLKTQVQNKLDAILGAFSAGLQEQSSSQWWK